MSEEAHVDVIVLLFHFSLTRWWILLSTTINPFYREQMTCEMYLWPHIDVSGTHMHKQTFSTKSSIHPLTKKKTHSCGYFCWNSLFFTAKQFRNDIWPPPRSSLNHPLHSSEIIEIRPMPRSDSLLQSSCLHASILMFSAHCCWLRQQGCSAKRVDLWASDKQNLVLCTLATPHLWFIIWDFGEITLVSFQCRCKNVKLGLN